jgi:hypothetical protein
MSRLPLPESGDRFGKWTVIGGVTVPLDASQNRAFMCRCDCGKESLVALSKLRRQPFGCSECFYDQRRNKSNTLHDSWGSWYNMVKRCTKPDAPNYRWYGARGVRVCARWLGDFQAFLVDMGPRPSETRRDENDPWPELPDHGLQGRQPEAGRHAARMRARRRR